MPKQLPPKRARVLPRWFMAGHPCPIQVAGAHPLVCVECFACGTIMPMMTGPGGEPQLPPGWAMVRPMSDGKLITEVYASVTCIGRAQVMASARFKTDDVKLFIMPPRPISFITVAQSTPVRVPKPDEVGKK